MVFFLNGRGSKQTRWVLHRFVKACCGLSVVGFLCCTIWPGSPLYAASISATPGITATSPQNTESSLQTTAPDNADRKMVWYQTLGPAALSVLTLVLIAFIAMNLKKRLKAMEYKNKQRFRDFSDDLARLQQRINDIAKERGYSVFPERNIVRKSADTFITKGEFDEAIRDFDHKIDKHIKEYMKFPDSIKTKSMPMSSNNVKIPEHSVHPVLQTAQRIPDQPPIKFNNSEDDLCQIFNLYHVLSQTIINQVSSLYQFASMRVEQAGFMNVDIVMLADSDNKDAYYLRTGRPIVGDDRYMIILDPQRERYSDSELESLSSVFQVYSVNNNNRHIVLKQPALAKQHPQGYQLVRKGIIEIV